jgi:hypothetical protein
MEDARDRALFAGALAIAIPAGAAGIGKALGRGRIDPSKIPTRETKEGIEEVAKLDSAIEAVKGKVLQRVQKLHTEINNRGFRDPKVVAGARKLQEKTIPKLTKLEAKRAGTSTQGMQRSKDLMARMETELAEESAAFGRKAQKLRVAEMEAEIEVDLLTEVGAKAQSIGKARRASLKLTKRARKAEKSANEKRTAATAAGRIARGERDPNVTAYLTEAPVTSGDARYLGGMVRVAGRVRDLAQQTALKITKSPETVGREQGFTGTVATMEVEEALRQEIQILSHYDGRMVKLFNQLGKAMGIGVVKRHRNGEWAAPVAEAWHKGGIRGVTQQFGDDVARPWQHLMDDMEQAYGGGVKVGALERMGPEDLVRMGLPGGAYFPQGRKVTGEWVADKHIASIMRAHKAAGHEITRAKAAEIAGRIQQNSREGLKKVGNIDFERTVPGSTADKVRAGFTDMITDPKEMLRIYHRGLAHRISFGQRFGPNGELKTAFIEAAAEEGGSRPIMTSLMDHYLASSYTNEAMREIAHFVTSYGILTKLGLAAIPNFTQPINTLLFAGVKSQVQAIGNLVRGQDRRLIMKGLNIHEAGPTAVREVMLTGEARGPLDRVVRGFLGANLFTPVEMWNRIHAGATGMAMARDLSAKAIAGRLRGNHLAVARRQMRSLGLDLDGIVKRGALSEVELEKAIHHGTRLTQFLPDITTRPTKWQTPLGRMVTQFKNFAFNQAKFVRDQVFGEAAQGNIRPLAYFLTVYPLAGEFVNETVDAIKGRDRKHLLETLNQGDSPLRSLGAMVENIAAVGGIGLVWNAAMSARFGDPLSFFAGPVVSDIAEFGTEVFRQGPTLDAVWQTMKNDPTMAYGKLLASGGVVGMEALLDALDREGTAKPTGQSGRHDEFGDPIGLEDLL